MNYKLFCTTVVLFIIFNNYAYSTFPCKNDLTGEDLTNRQGFLQTSNNNLTIDTDADFQKFLRKL